MYFTMRLVLPIDASPIIAILTTTFLVGAGDAEVAPALEDDALAAPPDPPLPADVAVVVVVVIPAAAEGGGGEAGVAGFFTSVTADIWSLATY